MNHPSWLVRSTLPVHLIQGTSCGPGTAAVALLGALALSSCGSGTAAIVGGTGDSGGGTTVLAAIAAFTVTTPEEPDQARLQFELSKAATVEFFYQVPGNQPLPMKHIGGGPLGDHSRDLPANPPGVPHSIPWNFAREEGLEALPGASFYPGVLVYAIIPGTQEQPLDGANALTLGLGNDAPVIAIEEPAPEVDGVVPIQLQLSDTSGDVVAILVEFDIQGDGLDWQPARPGGLDAKDPTPEPTLSGIVVSPVPGTELVFFWDTDFDLPRLESDVRLRFTPLDQVVAGVTKETGPFRIDNNAEPIVQLDSGPVIVNPDSRRGIPIPFRVVDPEGDPVGVVFQWRRVEEPDFPPLELSDLEGILADPVRRRESHVCTPFPSFASGRLLARNSSSVRLPELAAEHSSLVGLVLTGIAEPLRTGPVLELLQVSTLPRPMPWNLTGPVKVIPAVPVPLHTDTASALVLGSGPTGGWKVEEIDLATGQVLRLLASGMGAPRGMARSPDGGTLFIASDAIVARVSLAEEGAIVSIAHRLLDGPRGIVAVGSDAAVVSGDGGLARIDFMDGFVVRLFDGLSMPWGVALDPVNAGRYLVVEKGANRLVSLDPAKGSTEVLRLEPELCSPEAISTVPSSPKALVVARSCLDGGAVLLEADLGSANDSDGDGSFENRVRELARFATPPACVTAAEDGFRAVALPAEGTVAIGGGVVQRRRITSFNPIDTTVTVDPPFQPHPQNGQPWRIDPSTSLQSHSPVGPAERIFTWDSSDVVAGGQVVLQVVPIDTDGVSQEFAQSKAIRTGLDVPAMTVAADSGRFFDDDGAIAVGDVTHDGINDLVRAVGGSVALFTQTAPGRFAIPPISSAPDSFAGSKVCLADITSDGRSDIVGGGLIFYQPLAGFAHGFVPSIRIPGLSSVADVNRDGLLDAIVLTAETMEIHLQPFPQTPTPNFVLGGSGATSRPSCVESADLDANGLLDLVTSNPGSENVTVFLQPEGGFEDSDATPDQDLRAPLGVGNPLFVTLGDLTGSGRFDMVVAYEGSPGQGILAVHSQSSPAGLFSNDPSAVLSSSPFNPTAIAQFDANIDGRLDLFATNRDVFIEDVTSPRGIVPFYMDSDNRFLAASPIGNSLFDSFVGLSPVALAAGDLDADGLPDLAAAFLGTTSFDATGELNVFFGTNPRPSGTTRVTQFGMEVASVVQDVADPYLRNKLLASDFDGNGSVDILFSGGFLGRQNAQVFLQEPTLVDRFPRTPNLEFRPESPSIETADLDGDGLSDLVTANRDENRVAVYLNRRGHPIFSDAPDQFLGNGLLTPGAEAVALADFDDDGRVDIASANEHSIALFFQAQELPGQYPDQTSLLLQCTETQDLRAIGAGDVNNDGLLDLVAARSDPGSSTLAVFSQTLRGSFTCSLLITHPLSAEPDNVQAHDVDVDGRLDLVLTESASARGVIEILFGSSQAPESVVLNFLLPAGSVSVSDVDRNNALDLVVPSYVFGNPTVVFQTGRRLFGRRESLRGPLDLFATPCLVSRDLDGDGDIDVAVATDSIPDDRIDVFWNAQ